jgi:hypothetical protein
MRTIRRRNWFLRRIVLGFAVAALVAPAAAQARVDEGGAGGSSKSTELRKSWPGSEPTNAYELSRVIRDAPKGQSSWPGVDPTSGQSYPRWSPSADVVTADGFGWDDAGVGVGIVLGLVLLGGAAFRVTSHRGKTQTA